MNLSFRNFGYALLIVDCLLSMKCDAQQQAPDAYAFMRKAQNAYHGASYLGFGVKYLYSNAGAAVKAMDSLSGAIQMDKGRCRLVIDGTETVVTGKYMIQVVEEQKTIVLAAAGRALPMDPTQLLDTIFRQMKDVQAAITTEGRNKVLDLRFPQGSIYTSIRMVMDSVTGYFSRIVYGVRTAGLVGQDQIEQPGRPAPYKPEGRIDMLFSHYEQGKFGDAIFDEQNFFTRTAGQFEPAGRFKDYHIFLASSNL